ncbi:hypothetical protein, partial [Streptomyces globisporus]|uniref:hypothetical protein n=1 Tax=Streptomyces globisporus TaxID=1908 RepID=UPI001F19E3E8
MKVKYGRAIACLVVSAIVGTMLPQAAYAAPVSTGDGEGITDALSGWFSDGEESEGPGASSTGGTPVLPSREKLPRG